MTKMLFYLHKRIYAQQYGRAEILDILARKTLKSIARSTGQRIQSNRWLKTLDFLHRAAEDDQVEQFQIDFSVACQKYARTHAVSIGRTLLVLRYLNHLRTTNSGLPATLAEMEPGFIDRGDTIWLNEFASKVGVSRRDCGHFEHRGEGYTLSGNAESWDHRESACHACGTRLIDSGERNTDHHGNLVLSIYLTQVRSVHGDRYRDRRQPGIQFNERYQCYTDGSWTPYTNLISGYHSSKSTGFNVIDSPWFRRHRRAFGMELEVQTTNRTVNVQEAAGRVHDALNPSGTKGEYCFFERDGSIGDGGFEIVTQPAGLDIHREKMRLFLNDPSIKRGLRSHEGGSCGLHIHVGRQYLTQAQIYRVQSFLNDVRNEALIKKISRRYGNSYCRIRPEMAKLSPVGKSTGERYEALNVTGRDTVEFRIFRGSLRYESVMAALEFVDSLLTFCMPGQTAFNDFNSIGFRRFITRSDQSPDTKFLRSYLSLNSTTDNEQPALAA